MVTSIKELPVSDLEFQMFVLDELADELLADKKDIIKLTIGITELEIPESVRQVFSNTIFDYEKTHRVYPQGIPELKRSQITTMLSIMWEPRLKTLLSTWAPVPFFGICSRFYVSLGKRFYSPSLTIASI